MRVLAGCVLPLLGLCGIADCFYVNVVVILFSVFEGGSGMRKIVLAVFFLGCLLFPLSVFAGGGKDMCELTIENKTGAHITQIIIEETESDKEPEKLVRNMENNTSVVMPVKRNVLYNIILAGTDERQYAKRRQTWDVEAASIVIERRDIVNANLWDKARNLIDASIPFLEQVGETTAAVGESIGESVEEGYRQVKENEGIRKAIDALGKFTEAGLKIGVDLMIEAGKITVRVSRYTMDRIEEIMRNFNDDEKQAIDEYVVFAVTDE